MILYHSGPLLILPPDAEARELDGLDLAWLERTVSGTTVAAYREPHKLAPGTPDPRVTEAPSLPAPRDLLEELVQLCWREGALYGARPSRASKTLTVRGKRRYRIRLQSDICTAILGLVQNATPFYPDLWLDVCEHVEELRATGAAAGQERRR